MKAGIQSFFVIFAYIFGIQTQSIFAQVASNLTQGGNLTQVAQAANLTSLLSLLANDTQDLQTLMTINMPFTVFAPTNQAISNLVSMMPNIPQDVINAVLQYHVIPGMALSSSMINSSNVVKTLLTNNNFVNLGNNTPQILEVVKNSMGVKVSYGTGNASVVAADNFVSNGQPNGNGVVHAIDSVLMLPMNTSQVLTMTNMTNTLAQVAVNLSIANSLDSKSGITIFAPSDMAFATISSIVANSTNTTLIELLRYHVIEGLAYSSDISNGLSLKSVNGTNVTFYSQTLSDQSTALFVNNARIIMPNIPTRNGVIHIIDQVLNPNNMTMAPTSGQSMGMPAFAGADFRTSMTSGAKSITTGITTFIAGALISLVVILA